MNTNEIRVGNVVKIVGSRALMFKHPDRVIVDARLISLCNRKKILLEPIEITYSVLSEYGIDLKDLDLNEYPMAINNYTFIGYNGGAYIQIEREDMCECINLKHIKYLHQLQNLYFALTNKELEVQECDASKAGKRTKS